MKFRTEWNSSKSEKEWSHKQSFLAIGSCFVENIGRKLQDLKFNIQLNPTGILFNPESIYNLLNAKPTNQAHLVEQNGILKSLDYHSKFYTTDQSSFLEMETKVISQVQQQLLSVNHLILTFGTAWAYRYIPTNQIVANCQKLPQKEFTKELLDLETLKNQYQSLFLRLKKANPALQITLTVSPVRHTKDGLIENNWSKSILLLLCQHLSQSFTEFVNYFPAYEIQMDDLRDYRFYDKDLIHPNQQAVDYIFEKVGETYFNDATKQLNQDIIKLNALKRHLPIHQSEVNQTQKDKMIALENQIKKHLS